MKYTSPEQAQLDARAAFADSEEFVDFPGDLRARFKLSAPAGFPPGREVEAEPLAALPRRVALVVIPLDFCPIVLAPAIREGSWSCPKATALDGLDPGGIGEPEQLLTRDHPVAGVMERLHRGPVDPFPIDPDPHEHVFAYLYCRHVAAMLPGDDRHVSDFPRGFG